MTAKKAATENPLNIHQKILKVMEQVTFAKKVKKDRMQYAVVSYDNIVSKCRAEFIAQGIHVYPQNMVVTQNGNRTEMTLDARFQNIDDKDDFILVPSAGYGIDPQDKGPGKAETYAMKSAILKTLLMESGEGEDPDFNQENEHEPETAQENTPKFTRNDDGWHGPLNKTDLKANAQTLAVRLEQVQTEDDFKALAIEYRPMVEQLQQDLPTWYFGDNNQPGMKRKIEDKKQQIQARAA